MKSGRTLIIFIQISVLKSGSIKYRNVKPWFNCFVSQIPTNMPRFMKIAEIEVPITKMVGIIWNYCITAVRLMEDLQDATFFQILHSYLQHTINNYYSTLTPWLSPYERP